VELHAFGFISCSPTDANKFVEDFENLLKQQQIQLWADPKRFSELMMRYKVSMNDGEILARHIFRFSNFKQSGKALLYSLSRIGHVNATIRILASAYLQHNSRNAMLLSRELAWPREHLKQAANAPGSQNFRAMTLEGKIAVTVKNEEYAIKMFTKAMEAAVASSEKRMAEIETRPTRRKGTAVDYLQEKDPMELSAPWVDLTQLHKSRGEIEECMWPLTVGCQQDDPWAHYFRSTYIRIQYLPDHEDGEAVEAVRSAWLFHVTKAATSGVAAAAHELGLFYMKVPWKHIKEMAPEDEPPNEDPPDHLKPTVFDSYPAPLAVNIRTTSSKILALLGLKTKSSMTQQESIYHSACWPYEPEQRYFMAKTWLKEAYSYGFAPACLDLAKICMAETIPGHIGVPKPARELSSERYTYASKQEHDADPDREIEPPQFPQEDTPNPHYDIKEAQAWLREIFYCHTAHELGKAIIAQYRIDLRMRAVSKVTDEDSLITEANLKEVGHPEHITKWFRQVEIREQVEDRIDDLWTEAKRICDDRKWSLSDDQGGLVYRAKA
jgi:hypothetical protein